MCVLFKIRRFYAGAWPLCEDSQLLLRYCDESAKVVGVVPDADVLLCCEDLWLLRWCEDLAKVIGMVSESVQMGGGTDPDLKREGWWLVIHPIVEVSPLCGSRKKVAGLRHSSDSSEW